jgi:hypothetical protein
MFQRGQLNNIFKFASSRSPNDSIISLSKLCVSDFNEDWFLSTIGVGNRVHCVRHIHVRGVVDLKTTEKVVCVDGLIVIQRISESHIHLVWG